MNKHRFSTTRACVAFFCSLFAFLVVPLAKGEEPQLIAHHHGVAFAGFGVDNPPDISGLQFGLHCMAREMGGMQLGLGASAKNASGVQFALATSMTSERLKGMQFALAIVEAEQGMSGFQLAFFRTSAGNHIVEDKQGKRIEPARKTISKGLQMSICGAYAENLDGVQLSFWDAKAQDLDGIQFGILHTAERFSGLQAGLWNTAGVEGKDAHGVQLGLVNWSENFSGLQVGVINLAKELKGVQLGLINYIESSTLPVLPILNASF